MSMGALIEKFRSVGLERLERMNALLVQLEREPEDPESCEELLREIHTLKGEAKMMGFADINLVAHQVESVLLKVLTEERLVDPGPVELAFEGLDLMRGLLTKSGGGANLDLTGFVDRIMGQGMAQGAEEPSEEREQQEEQEQAKEKKSPPTTRTRIEGLRGDGEGGSLRIQTSTSLRVDVEKLERLGELAGETLLMARRFGYRLDELQTHRRQMRELFKELEGNLPKSQSTALRSLLHRLDATESALREENHLVNLRASQLDDQSRHLRHIPLAQVLSHYPRAVRDLAISQGKKVRMVDTFGNVEVDRAIPSALSEPLLHLVRNAVDHGIESPEAREAAGKDPEGEILLSADYAGDSIRVLLQDDGKGIDPGAIRERAEERGLMAPEEARRLTDQEAMALIFEPGFSTKETVSDVSGRGMGMNVVRQQIARIGGFIEVTSEVGEGTTFTLHLPVTSAINAVLLFTLGDRHFALTAKDVERVDLVTKEELKRAHGGVCIATEEGFLPVVDWTAALGLPERGGTPDHLTVLVLRKGSRRVALWVDDVVGEREAVSRPLGEFLQGVSLCRGVALTDSGSVVPLLNVVQLLEQDATEARMKIEEPLRQRSFTAVTGRQALSIKTVLVVEDSEVTRSLVVSILKGQNYRVLEADDGHHGWARLQRSRVDLVLTDIQMPGMSGLELLAKIRGSEQFARLPVIILSTLGEAEDKRRAMRLGADGYLVKLSFQEQELLDTVARFLE